MSEVASRSVPRWIFDALPPSGARRGGDPSEFVFSRSLDSLVREALQNSNDQSLPGARTRAEVRIDLEELRGQRLAGFRDAIGWDVLHQHVVAASGVSGASKAQQLRSAAGQHESLIVLRIEDRNTSGLKGEEDTGESNFRALCRDSLFSHKQHGGAGGSYGLGKSVYWAFSALSTVIFHSTFTDKGARRSRLIGRVELPSHGIGRREFMGPGWFGQPDSVQGGERAISLWDDEAARLAARLCVDRLRDIDGTTILVVGFRDPSEEPEPIERTLDRMRECAGRHFWPAMNFASPLRVLVGGVPVAESEAVRPFADAWRGRAGGRGSLEESGDVACRSVAIQLPRRRADKEDPAVQNAQCELIVRLAEPPVRGRAASDLESKVAIFRGPGMVVTYLAVDPGRVLPPFHALLACGEARDPANLRPSDSYLESFLRASEPPGHDAWLVTPRLKEEYVQGGGARISQLLDDVRRSLRDMLLPSATDTLRGPDLLQRRFPLGNVGGGASPPGGGGQFNFTNLKAVLDGEVWRFSGSVDTSVRGYAWVARIALKVLGGDGGEVGSLVVATFGVRRAGVATRLADGAAIVEVPKGVGRVDFEGVSEAIGGQDQLCEIGLEITGQVLGVGGP